MERDFVAPGWQEPPEGRKASLEATGSFEVERECHQGHAIPSAEGMSMPFVKRGIGKEICT